MKYVVILALLIFALAIGRLIQENLEVPNTSWESSGGLDIAWSSDWRANAPQTGDRSRIGVGPYEEIGLLPADDAACGAYCGLSLTIYDAATIDPESAIEAEIALRTASGWTDVVLEGGDGEAAWALIVYTAESEPGAWMIASDRIGNEVYIVVLAGEPDAIADNVRRVQQQVEIDDLPGFAGIDVAAIATAAGDP